MEVSTEGVMTTSGGWVSTVMVTALVAVPVTQSVAVMATTYTPSPGGVQVVADLYSIKGDRMGRRARELEELGVDHVMLHLGHDEAHADPSRHCLEGLDEVLEAVSIPVGVGTFGVEEAVEAVKRGASFVVQGNPMLSEPDALDKMRTFIDAVHGVVS